MAVPNQNRSISLVTQWPRPGKAGPAFVGQWNTGQEEQDGKGAPAVLSEQLLLSQLYYLFIGVRGWPFV